MPFAKITYVDGKTIISAKNLNDIQDELIRQAEENNTPIATTTVPGKVMPSSDFDIAADGTIATYYAYRTDAFTGSGTAKYRIV